MSFVWGLCACNNERIQNKKDSTITSEEQSLKTALQLNPDSFLLVQNLSVFYANKENYDASLKTVNDAIKRDSTNPYLWDLYAMIAIQKADTVGALSALEKAVQLFPDPQYIISLGSLYAQTKNPLALEMADALLIGSKAKAEKEAYFIKGLYYSFNNEKEKAIPFFDKCIALNYTFMNAYMEKGLALYDLKKYQLAADILEKAVTIQNNFSQGYYYLGQCYEKLNRTNEAIDAYNTAIIRDPEYVEAAEALNRLGVK